MIDPASFGRRTVLHQLLGAFTSVLWPVRAARAAIAPASERLAFEASALEALAAVGRALFPHDFLPPDVYLDYARQLAVLTAADPAMREAIRDALASLPSNYAALPADARETALRGIETTPGFMALRRTAIASLYRDPRVWKAFGYPGPSAPFGGYVNRSLADLDWLPSPDT